MNRIFALIFNLSFLVSCVGTIEETRFETTEVVADAVEYERFDGINEAIAISHDKVEVYFYEAENINAENVAYQIHYDGAEYPIFVPGNALSPRADSRLMYTVDGLVPNREYYFEVQFLNLLTGQVSSSTEKKVVKTFYNRTADFYGVESVIHQPGPDGTNFVKVSWGAAVRESSGVIPMLADVSKYEVTVLNASRLISDFDNENLPNEERKIAYFNESSTYGIIGGLQPNNTYYIRVRAIHHGYYENLDNIDYQHEKNNKYVEITMLSGDGSEIDFESDSFVVTKPDGVEGLNSAVANWDFPTGGAFDHFRIIYKGSDPESEDQTVIENTLRVINPSGSCNLNPDGIYCRQIDFSTNSANILDLNVDWHYTFILAVCLNESCSSYILSDTEDILTVGDVANFNGFEGFELGSNFGELSFLKLSLTPPDLSQGLLEGIIIYYDIDNNGGNFKALNPIGEVSSFVEGSDLSLMPYDFVNDDEIILSGLDVENLLALFFKNNLPESFSTDEVAKSYFFKYQRVTVSGVIEEDLEKPAREIKPVLVAANEVINVTNCDITPGYTRVDWELPTSGIYTNFKADVLVGTNIIDTIYFSEGTNSFQQIDYFSTLGVGLSDVIKFRIRPIILYNGIEYDPLLKSFEVTTVTCTPSTP